MGGLLPGPFEGMYISTKHALEGYTETLRLEVKGFGIRVSIVEPGFFKTGLFKSETPVSGHLPEYDVARKTRRGSVRLSTGGRPWTRCWWRSWSCEVANSTSPRIRYAIGRERGAITLKKAGPGRALREPDQETLEAGCPFGLSASRPRNWISRTRVPYSPRGSGGFPGSSKNASRLG